jgi:hypothetical protein
VNCPSLEMMQDAAILAFHPAQTQCPTGSRFYRVWTAGTNYLGRAHAGPSYRKINTSWACGTCIPAWVVAMATTIYLHQFPRPRAAHDFCRQHSFAKRKYLSTSLLILAIASTRPHSLYLFVADSNHGWPVPAISVRCATRPLQLQSQGRHHGQPPATSSAEEEARRASHRVQQAPRQLFDSTIWQYERQADAQEDKDLCQGCAMDSARFPSVHATRRSGCFVVRHFHSRRYGHRRLYYEDTGKIQ